MAEQRARLFTLLAGVAWALAFGAVHVHWAVGGRFALADVDAADAAFQRTWFQVYNLSVAVASFVLAVAVLLLAAAVRGDLGRLARTAVRVAGVLLLVRGGVGAIELVVRLVTARPHLALEAWAIDLYMLLGGALMVAAGWGPRRRGRAGRGPRRRGRA